jgi:hypothetical protein
MRLLRAVCNHNREVIPAFLAGLPFETKELPKHDQDQTMRVAAVPQAI